MGNMPDPEALASHSAYLVLGHLLIFLLFVGRQDTFDLSEIPLSQL